MFSTCYICAARLPRNDALEVLPIGRRLAFDERTGRLWVVCRACERWNLVPLHERFEGIEACERLFRESRERMATGEITLARTRSGLDLIRIGQPLRPEFAAWRYGNQLARRKRRQRVQTSLALVATGAAFAGGVAAYGGALGTSLAALVGVYAFNPVFWYRFSRDAVHGSDRSVVARVQDNHGATLRIERWDARGTHLIQPSVTGEPFALKVRHNSHKTTALSWLRSSYQPEAQIITGDAALLAAQQLLPAVNRTGASTGEVADAVALIDHDGGPAATLHSLVTRRGIDAIDEHENEPWVELEARRAALPPEQRSLCLGMLPPAERLALEMALHEESERRAAQSELGALETAWREADEIARIADAL